MNNPSEMGKVVLVLGMHRSGTSAVMRLINLLGADIGTDLLPPAPDNPSGFWEHRGVVRIHDELLGELGRSWHDVRSLPSGWLDSDAAGRARKKLVALLHQEFSASPLWAVKDPRLCRLLPLWKQVLGDLNTQAHAIFVVRHPDEVAQSVLARDGIPVKYTRLSWLEHMVEAEIASRQMLRVAVSYNDLLLDWTSVIQRIAEELALHWPVSSDEASAEVDRFLNKGARHHAKEPSDRTLPKLAQWSYDVLLEKARDKSADWSAVQRVSDSYRASADVFLDGIQEAAGQIVEKDAEIKALTVRLEMLCAACREIAAQTYLQGAHVDSIPGVDLAKIYYRKEDESYDEARSVHAAHQGLWNITSLKFELSPGAEADFLRFDPSELPGEFAVRDFQINGRAVAFLDGLFSLNGTHVVALTEKELRLASMDNDPYFELDCRSFEMDINERQVFQMSCSRITPYTELGKILEKGLSEFKSDWAAHDKIQTHDFAEKLDSIGERQEVASSRSRIAIEDLKSQMHRETVALSERVDALVAAGERASETVAQQTSELVMLNRQMHVLIELQSLSLAQRVRRRFQKQPPN